MFEQELAELEKKHLLRSLVAVESMQGPRVTVNGRSMLLLCSNDYLGLACHPKLREAACSAMNKYGFGSGASRLVSGNTLLHEELERKIAEFKNTESAVVFNSGYAANTGIIPAMVGEGDAVFSDGLNHASIIDGCRLSRARVNVYRHKDMDHLEGMLKSDRTSRKKLIVTDGVFSMDGDMAPLPEIANLAERYDAILMVDDAHATGVFGKIGRGTVEHFGLEGRVHIQMGTLGKALGSFGAYAAGDKGMVQYLLNRARSFIFSTSLPPAVCAASIAAIKIVEAEPDRRMRLWRNRDKYVNGLLSAGIDAGPSESPIIPIIIGDAAAAIRVSTLLFDDGVFASAIRPPTVPERGARIRTTVTSVHSESDIDAAIEIFGRLKKEGHIPS